MSTKVSCSALLVGAISVMAGAAEKPRVFTTETGVGQATWEASVGATQGSLAFTGGTSPENREVMKAFSHRYPAVMVTADRKKADYIVRLDHEAINPTTPFVHGNKVAVFNKEQGLMYKQLHAHVRQCSKGAFAAITAEDKPVTSK